MSYKSFAYQGTNVIYILKRTLVQPSVVHKQQYRPIRHRLALGSK